MRRINSLPVVNRELLEKSAPGVILSGETYNGPGGIYLSDDDHAKKKLRWVAVRGGIADWAVYHEYGYNDKGDVGMFGEKILWTNERIARRGMKMSKRYIKNLFNVDAYAENWYRD